MSRRRVSASVLAALLTVSLLSVPLSSGGAADGKKAYFEENVVREERGDVMYVTVHAKEPATVNIGSPDDGFWAQIDVGKGKTTIGINTYRASNGSHAVLEFDEEAVKRTSKAGPLEPGTYSMNVTVSDEEQGRNEQQDGGSFVIEGRETNGLRAYTLPSEVGFDEVKSADEPPSALRERMSPLADGALARNDWLVLELDATGLSGFIDDVALDGTEDDVTLEARESNHERNTQPTVFNGSSAKSPIVDEENDLVYFVFDTAELRPEHGDVEVGDEYEATFTLGGSNPLVPDDSGPESVTTTFTVVERRAELDYDGEVFVVENETTVAGTTTLAPGTELRLVADRGGEDPFFWPKDLTVTENRTFEATFDFTDVRRGSEFAFVLQSPEGKRTVPAVVAPRWRPPDANTTTTPSTTNTTTTTTNTTDSTATTLPTRVPTERPITAESVSSGGLPGFGIPVALVALAAVALLVTRRR